MNYREKFDQELKAPFLESENHETLLDFIKFMDENKNYDDIFDAYLTGTGSYQYAEKISELDKINKESRSFSFKFTFKPMSYFAISEVDVALMICKLMPDWRLEFWRNVLALQETTGKLPLLLQNRFIHLDNDKMEFNIFYYKRMPKKDFLNEYDYFVDQTHLSLLGNFAYRLSNYKINPVDVNEFIVQKKAGGFQICTNKMYLDQTDWLKKFAEKLPIGSDNIGSYKKRVLFINKCLLCRKMYDWNLLRPHTLNKPSDVEMLSEISAVFNNTGEPMEVEVPGTHLMKINNPNTSSVPLTPPGPESTARLPPPTQPEQPYTGAVPEPVILKEEKPATSTLNVNHTDDAEIDAKVKDIFNQMEKPITLLSGTGNKGASSKKDKK